MEECDILQMLELAGKCIGYLEYDPSNSTYLSSNHLSKYLFIRVFMYVFIN